MTTTLPSELTGLVDWSVTELGRVIKIELGSAAFTRIEKIRRYVKSPATRDIHGLLRLKKDLKKLSSREHYEIAHAFALMLELINCCESAYRVFRLEDEIDASYKPKTQGRIIHVLTAHPTESRNPKAIFFFKKIQELLRDRLCAENPRQSDDLHALLRMAWRISLSRTRKPTVMDEAEYVYSLALDEDIIELLIQQKLKSVPLYLRTWVGGDKDGHPGVDEKTLQGSLQLSRRQLTLWFRRHLQIYFEDLEPLEGVVKAKDLVSLHRSVERVKSLLARVVKLEPGDGGRIQALCMAFDQTVKNHLALFGHETETLRKLQTLFNIFPALVIPLEIREDSRLVHEALSANAKNPNITRMMKKLHQLSGTADSRKYVRGFVLSQCESAEDIQAGIRLVEKYLGQGRLPVIPLFESAHSLGKGVQIVREFLGRSRNVTLIRKYWDQTFEVMLGYSDSSKENGAFPSRFLIQSAVLGLEAAISRKKLTPLFFHGSGGSVERGGGSIQEQTQWWPLSALQTPKMTIQGEMIYRNYISPLILERQLQLLEQERDERAKKPAVKLSRVNEKRLRRLADFIQASYQERLKNPDFHHMIEVATPYSFLNNLKLGSRPASRQGPLDTHTIRAIPWVLSWTQTRALFPSWWGFGSFWKTLNASEKKGYRQAFKESVLFRSYVKLLGFTLSKVELDVFALYVRDSKLEPAIAAEIERSFRQEYRLCLKCVREISGESNLLWYRRWLNQSIDLRSPLIHPLNVLQIIALENKDIPLLREAATGIACGMLTTG